MTDARAGRLRGTPPGGLSRLERLGARDLLFDDEAFERGEPTPIIAGFAIGRIRRGDLA